MSYGALTNRRAFGVPDWRARLRHEKGWVPCGNDRARSVTLVSKSYRKSGAFSGLKRTAVVSEIGSATGRSVRCLGSGRLDLEHPATMLHDDALSAWHQSCFAVSTAAAWARALAL